MDRWLDVPIQVTDIARILSTLGGRAGQKPALCESHHAFVKVDDHIIETTGRSLGETWTDSLCQKAPHDPLRPHLPVNVDRILEWVRASRVLKVVIFLEPSAKCGHLPWSAGKCGQIPCCVRPMRFNRHGICPFFSGLDRCLKRQDSKLQAKRRYRTSQMSTFDLAISGGHSPDTNCCAMRPTRQMSMPEGLSTKHLSTSPNAHQGICPSQLRKMSMLSKEGVHG